MPHGFGLVIGGVVEAVLGGIQDGGEGLQGAACALSSSPSRLVPCPAAMVCARSQVFRSAMAGAPGVDPCDDRSADGVQDEPGLGPGLGGFERYRVRDALGR